MTTLADLQRDEDQALLQRLAPCIGAGLRDLQSTRKTPSLVACRRALISILRYDHGWTRRRCAQALGWPLWRVKRMSPRK